MSKSSKMTDRERRVERFVFLQDDLEQGEFLMLIKHEVESAGYNRSRRALIAWVDGSSNPLKNSKPEALQQNREILFRVARHTLGSDARADDWLKKLDRTEPERRFRKIIRSLFFNQSIAHNLIAALLFVGLTTTAAFVFGPVRAHFVGSGTKSSSIVLNIGLPVRSIVETADGDLFVLGDRISRLNENCAFESRLVRRLAGTKKKTVLNTDLVQEGDAGLSLCVSVG